MAHSKPKVLLIGWDAADWRAIRPLVDQGKMPFLKKLIENGVSGDIATLQPALSPMLWTSIATGKRPCKHGIYGFTEPDPFQRNDQAGNKPVAQNQGNMEYPQSERVSIQRGRLVAVQPGGTNQRRHGL